MLVVSLSACVATGPAFTPAPAPGKDQALVYIYREETQPHGAVRLACTVDSVEAAMLYGRGYTRFYLAPGNHVIGINAPNVKPFSGVFWGGETYYFRLRVDFSSTQYPASAISITAIPGGIGEKEIVFYRLQPPKKDFF